MKGFDTDYADLTDYILKCTVTIWEVREGFNIDKLEEVWAKFEAARS